MRGILRSRQSLVYAARDDFLKTFIFVEFSTEITQKVRYNEITKEMRKKQLLPPQISQAIMENPQVLQMVMSILQQAQTPAPMMPNNGITNNPIM